MSDPNAEPPALPPETQWLRRLAGSHAIALDDPGKAWLVRTGAADVFALLPGDERSGHARRHLFRVNEGEALLGLPAPPKDGAIGLIAVPTATGEIVELGVVDLLALPGERTSARRVSAIESWVGQLARSLGEEGLPSAEDTEVEPGAAVELSPGATVRSGPRFVWAQVESGEVAPDDAGAASARFGAGSAFPLCPGLTFTAIGATKLRAKTTAEMLSARSLGPALAAFHDLALRMAVARARGRIGADAARLADFTGAQRAQFDTALERLERVLGGRSRTVEATSDSPLFDAFRLVADASGVEIDRPRALHRLAEGSDPVSALARAMSVSVRRVELDHGWWTEDGGAMLATRKDGRPIALLPLSARRYAVVDPADPASVAAPRLVTEEVAAELARDAWVLYRSFPRHALRAWEIVRPELARNGLDLFWVMSAAILGGLLALLVPIFTGIIFDDVIPEADRGLLAQYTVLLAVGAVAIALFGFGQSISLLRMRGKMDSAIQSAVWDRLLRLPMSFFRDFNAGDLANRAMGINAISSTLTGVTLLSVLSGVFSVFSAALMFYYDWKLALVGLVLIFVATVVSLLLYRAQLHYQRELFDLAGKISGQVLQIINGIAKLRVAKAEQRAFAAWAENFARQERLTLKAHSRANALTVFTSAFRNLSLLAIFIGVAFFSSELEVGEFVAFNSAFGQLFGGIMGLLRSLNTSTSIVPLYERARPILNGVPERTAEAADPGELRGRIDLDEVSFRYYASGEPVLSRVTFTVQPGEFIAIAGPSGAGKSTLLRLLIGFEKPVSGTISYDRRNMDGVDLHALRRQLGVVLQDGKLMPGSIFDNIVGSAALGEDEAWEAARLAGLADQIRALPMGMNTFVAEGAVTFSGGQRQRLMIARAIVKRPRILLFDEATSALDNETQSIVTEAIASLNATRIVIAHRLSTIVRADRILVLEGGRLVQSGTYGELLATPGPFADLARRQMA
jgi:NHLM bacteriocin system ABC transporter ATP-binding protein